MSNQACYYDEKALLIKIQQGDQDAFIALYNRYHVALYNYILHFVKIPDIAEDIVQDVFLKAWEIKERINPAMSFTAYLYTISRNKVFKLMKKTTADEALRQQIMRQLRQNTEEPELQLLWQQYEQTLFQAIKQLPPQRQRVFRLCREEGKSYEEAAMELGISRNTVKEHMVLAVKGLKEYFLRHADISFLLTLLAFLHM